MELARRLLADKKGESAATSVSSENYLGRLDPIDAQNVRAIVEKLRGGNLVGGRLVAVGSSVRSSDYNDIDLRVLNSSTGGAGTVSRHVEASLGSLEGFTTQPRLETHPDKLQVRKRLIVTPSIGKPLDVLLPESGDLDAEQKLRLERKKLGWHSELSVF